MVSCFEYQNDFVKWFSFLIMLPLWLWWCQLDDEWYERMRGDMIYSENKWDEKLMVKRKWSTFTIFEHVRFIKYWISICDEVLKFLKYNKVQIWFKKLMLNKKQTYALIFHRSCTDVLFKICFAIFSAFNDRSFSEEIRYLFLQFRKVWLSFRLANVSTVSWSISVT